MKKPLRLSDFKLDHLSDLYTSTDIAIIGISVRTAFANNGDEFWKNLTTGKDCIHEIPDSRQEDIDNYLPYIFKVKLDESIKKNKKRYVRAAYLNEVDKFDYRFFKLSPKEASLMDPCQRLFLETAYETLEDAGYAGKNASTYETGVYVGYSDDVKLNYFQMVGQIEPNSIPVAIAGNLSSIVPSRISYFLDLKGPAVLVDTACSSSLVAVHLALQAIRNGDCQQAIAGGVRINLVPIAHKATIGIESSDGKTKTFSDDSDGTGVGEGSAAVLLKPLDKAIKDRDNIYAVLKGSAVNQDGQSLGITAPSVEAQTRLILKAWDHAKIDPETISYIEAHGTGTRIGDPIEVEAIKNAFETFTNRKQFCAIGSVKTNIGHLFEASGIFGLIKAVLSLKYKKLPPTIHFKRPNKNIAFENSPVYINDELRHWKTNGFPLRCGITAFGFSGTNCHVVLEQAPLTEKQQAGKTDNHHVLTLSAKSKKSLIQLVKQYHHFLIKNKKLALHDICYTANIGRSHFNHRIAIITNHMTDLRAKLKQIISFNINIGECLDKEIYYGEHKTIQANKKGNKNDGCSRYGYEYSLSQSDFRELSEKGNIKIREFVQSGRNNSRLLKEIVQLYIKGADLEWEAFYEDMTTQKISLPLYPFDRERCWIDIPPFEEDTTKPLEGKLFFDMEWIEEELQESQRRDFSGNIVIIKDEKRIGDQVAQTLKQEGLDIVEVTFGTPFKELDTNCYQVNGSEENYEKLILKLEEQGKKIETILFMAAMVKDDAIVSLKQLHQSQSRGVFHLFHLTKMILKHYSTEKIEYIVIADYVNRVTGREKKIKPENAPVFGLTYAIDRECENISARCIDMDESTTVSNIVNELKSGKQFRAAAYRENQRYCERLIPIEIERIEDTKIKIQDKGVYLITGGTGGIGLEIGKYLANKKQGVHIALINRSKMPDPVQWNDILEENDDKKICNKIKGIREIEAKGGRVCLFSADVSNFHQMKKVLDELRAKFGTINGIIHSAGVEGEGLLVRKKEKKFANVLNPKVAGTWVLDHLTRDDHLDFLILFSSVATFLMNPGQTDYTAANAFLDSYTEYRNRLGKKTLAINWVTWKETGMAVDYNVNFDIIFKAIPTAEAIYAFDIALNKKMNRILIGQLNLDSKLINLLKNAQFRLADQIRNILDTSDAPLKAHSGDEPGKKIRKVKLTGRDDNKYTKSELLVAKVWGEVLGFDTLNLHDNFYELGGDSILATQVVNRMNTENNIKISLIEIFNYETIKELAEYVETLQSA
jgi:acyl transferase domain-containing protein/acyl carrier protein